MPRPRLENKKVLVAARVSPELAAEVKDRAGNFSGAVEEALRLWLAREKRRQPKGDPLATLPAHCSGDTA